MARALRWFWTFLRLASDRRSPRIVRVLLVVAALYAVMPLDLLPDWLPPIGWADDIGLTALLVSLAWNAIPKKLREPLPERAS